MRATQSLWVPTSEMRISSRPITPRSSRRMRCGLMGNVSSVEPSSICSRMYFRRTAKGADPSALDEAAQELERLPHVRHHFHRRLVVPVHLGGSEIDVDDGLLLLRVPEARRVLHRIVAHRDDEVGLLEAAGDVVARLSPALKRQSGSS